MPASRADQAEAERDVLAALIGVVHEPGVGATSVNGHRERVDDELGAHVVGHRPANDPPAISVLNGR